MYNKDLKELSRDELEYYTHALEIDLNTYKMCNKDIKAVAYKQKILLNEKDNLINKYKKCANIYKNRAHTYKVEMERCRRKLTRIYKLFDEWIFTVFKYYPLGSIELEFYIKAIENVRKEIKNV